MSRAGMAAVGAGLAVASAGAYYFLGPKGKAHQKKALALMNKMKKEAMQKVATAKNMTVPVYNRTVDALASTYAKQYKTYEKEIKAFASILKSEWKNVSKKTTKKTTTKRKRA